MKRKIIVIISTILIIILFASFIYLRNNQVINITGLTQSNETGKQSIILELENKGVADIKLLKVFINNSQLPNKVELVASYSSHLVAGGLLDEDPDIKFTDDISSIKIRPATNSEQRIELIKSKAHPTDYGLRITYEDKVEIVKIKYKYLGLVFTKTVDLK
ncbi:hypothetical protein D7Z26_00245 [Cohnella endophytica]|uniref:Uncharacterized protein n=1 Tax=Cohnella endophytica TaxID=2419778 RepID=A0A494Y5T7_9BACL|nr:hypothetical protein [Cohnella endophytica]RKP57982.1 hypothetical protein D7Z26_00245 [Cohnella endophytica]